MKKIEIDGTRVRELIAYAHENYFISDVFENLANEIARDNSIDVKVAKIILALNTIEDYRWIEMSTTRIIFYVNSRSADVVNISNEWLSHYEDGIKTEDVDLEDYLRWSAYRNEVMSR